MRIKNIFPILLLIGLVIVTACKGNTKEQNTTSTVSVIREVLTAENFEKLLTTKSDYILLDVRTPEEFVEKHLTGATNIDFNNSSFEQSVNALDKNKPVFLYCLSGGRSSSAMDVLEKVGFKEIYNLEGGIMAWTAANKALETADNQQSKGISVEEYNKIINSAPIVMVDFNATWCGPCKKVKPILEAMEKESKFKLVSIDVDENNDISTHFKIESIPLMKLYKNGKEVYSKLGYDDKLKDAEIKEINDAVTKAK